MNDGSGLSGRERDHAESQLTVKAMFEAWHPEEIVDNTSDGARSVRQMFELHLLPDSGDTRVVDTTPGDIRTAVRRLIDAGKISTAYRCTCTSMQCPCGRASATHRFLQGCLSGTRFLDSQYV
ncbi:hypothetical protein [Paraburkholderia gardini]|uniref:hypothetical protein n=1 Tax=Paraburkholderia gardini TaxID=2823469 RepID=UPI001E436F14|nr:hypothetical protein [Paraburkholderia gardini]